MAPKGRNKPSNRHDDVFSYSPSNSAALNAAESPSPEGTDLTPVSSNAHDIASPQPASSASEDDEFQLQFSPGKHSLSGSSSSDEDLANNGTANGRRSSLPTSHSAFLGPNAFAPPFYGRPPTPLPPSPSFTSLLRPPFSTTTSRPTTPDSSENETPNDTEAAVAKSARIATTVPRASPKVPTYEYYGFALYLASTSAFIIYLLWSYLPSPFLHQLGIYYYPNRWWSLAIPAFLVMLIVYIYVALAAYNTGYLTLPMKSIESLVDEAANIAVIDSHGKIRKGGHEKKHHDRRRGEGSEDWRKNWQAAWNTGTDAVMDIPIGGVCEILYGNDPDLLNIDQTAIS